MSGVPIWCAASRAIATQSRSRCAAIALRYAKIATATMTAMVSAWSIASAVMLRCAGSGP